MFWIGAAAGAFACMLVICAGFGVMFWQVARDRKIEGNEGGKWERMYAHWDKANSLSEQKNNILVSISDSLDRLVEITKEQAKG